MALIALVVRRQETFDSFVFDIGSCHSSLPTKSRIRIYSLYTGGLGLSTVISDLQPVSKTVFASNAGVPEDEFPIKLLRIQIS
jgi:hypothetical protein